MSETKASDLRAMPSSLNDACRKLDIAADEIESLEAKLAAAEARETQYFNGWKASEAKLWVAEAALEEIKNHWANQYDHPRKENEMYRGPYGIGVTDGHRACTEGDGK